MRGMSYAMSQGARTHPCSGPRGTPSGLVEDLLQKVKRCVRRTADPTRISAGNESSCPSTIPSSNGKRILDDGGETMKRRALFSQSRLANNSLSLGIRLTSLNPAKQNRWKINWKIPMFVSLTSISLRRCMGFLRGLFTWNFYKLSVEHISIIIVQTCQTPFFLCFFCSSRSLY